MIDDMGNLRKTLNSSAKKVSGYEINSNPSRTKSHLKEG